MAWACRGLTPPAEQLQRLGYRRWARGRLDRLNGVKVLEFSQIFAAPLGCQMLSDLGAEVIKVEPLDGEPWRQNAQFVPGESKGFQAMNRGKRSLAIDLSQPGGREAIHRLVKNMDVVVDQLPLRRLGQAVH